MIRRKRTTSLVRASRREEEDVNPNSYVTNLADCMLVVTVGLLIALVVHYGIDLSASPDEQIIGQEVNMDVDADGKIDAGYEQTGTVYKDAATGKYYVVPK